jgi:hypothetical protein
MRQLMPYGVQVRCDTRKCRLTGDDLEDLASALDRLLKSRFRYHHDRNHGGHPPEWADETTVESAEVRNTDPQPRLEIHITHAHPNGWPSALYNLEGEIGPAIDAFLDDHYPPVDAQQRPKIIIRWSKTTDTWYVLQSPPAPS